MLSSHSDSTICPCQLPITITITVRQVTLETLPPGGLHITHAIQKAQAAVHGNKTFPCTRERVEAQKKVRKAVERNSRLDLFGQVCSCHTNQTVEFISLCMETCFKMPFTHKTLENMQHHIMSVLSL